MRVKSRLYPSFPSSVWLLLLCSVSSNWTVPRPTEFCITSIPPLCTLYTYISARTATAGQERKCLECWASSFPVRVSGRIRRHANKTGPFPKVFPTCGHNSRRRVEYRHTDRQTEYFIPINTNTRDSWIDSKSGQGSCTLILNDGLMDHGQPA